MNPFRLARLVPHIAPILVTLGVSACSGGPGAPTTPMTSSGDFPGDALMTMASDKGTFHVVVRTGPEQPPTTGVDAVELTLTDMNGKPVEGQEIQLVPWMPVMGHGTDVMPVLQKLGGGKYVFTDVNLYMPGEWQLRFSFVDGKGQVVDSAEPVLQDVR